MPTYRALDPRRRADANQSDVDVKIAAALERIAQALRVALWEEGKQAGLSPIQVQMLVFLASRPAGVRAGDLAREFHLTPATVSETLDALERKKLLCREDDPFDRRAVMVKATRAGRHAGNTSRDWNRVIREAVASVRGDKVAHMRFLMRLIAELQKAGLVTVARMCSSCRYFDRRRPRPGTVGYCRLLEQPLRERDLRVDCPEHQPLHAES
jgi:DNA-binding MarR family transcriptional regulator